MADVNPEQQVNPQDTPVAQQGQPTPQGNPDPTATEAPTEEPKQEPAPPKIPEPEEAEPKPTGNPFVDELLTELRTHEVDIDKLFGDYLETGNEESIDLAYLEEKVGKLAAKGLVASVKAEASRIEAEEAEAAKTIYDSVGGEQTWNDIIKWITSGKSGLSKDGAQAYNDMLAKGGVQAQLAARELLNMFKQSPGFIQDASLQQADAPAQPTGLEPISRREYVEQLQDVVRKYGEESPQAQALHNRRLASMGNGVK